VDPGEKPQAAAVREVREETGIVAEPVTKLCG
jgi:8-oxo-dGTP pyrophosphatase MutT (NUDIX family)